MSIARLVVVLWLLFQVNSAVAAVVTEVLPNQDLVVLRASGDERPQVGSQGRLVGHGECLLEVIRAKDEVVTASSTECPTRNLLAPGSEIAFSGSGSAEGPAAPPSPEPRARADGRNGHVALIVGYIMSPWMQIEGMVYSGTDKVSGAVDYRFKDGIKLGVEWSRFRRNTWNNGASLEYMKLSFDTEADYLGKYGAFSGSISGGMSILTAAYLGRYRWDDFYLPIGVGYSSSTVESSSSLTRSLQTRLFYSLGVGFVAAENLLIEATSASYTVYAPTITESGVTIIPDIGKVYGLQLNLKILF